MKLAAAYLRVSTERQDEYSLDSQLKLIRDYAAKNSYIVPDKFIFVDDGISGRSARKRTQFQTMVGLAKDKARPFEVIIVWKFSRFARNQEESIVYKSMLARCGVTVVSISEPLAEGPFGSLIERILEWMDEFYSIRLSAEVKRGMAEKVSRGEPVCGPAFGYDLVGRLYVPNADAPVVRRVFSEYLSGKGLTAIARELGAEGVRTRRGNSPEKRWLEYMLNNPVYIGKIRWSTEGKLASARRYDAEGFMLIDGDHEPLIDTELWRAVQDKLAEAKRGRVKYARRDQPVDWMLKGLVRCSGCASALVYTPLSCPSMQCHKYVRGQCAVSHSLSIAKADRLVIAALENAVALPAFPIAPRTVSPERNAPDYAKLIAAEHSKLRRIQEAYEGGIDTLEEYAVKKKKLLHDIESFNRQAAVPPPVMDIPAFRERTVHMLELIKSRDVTEAAKSAALKTVVSYIIYDKPAANLEIYLFS